MDIKLTILFWLLKYFPPKAGPDVPLKAEHLNKRENGKPTFLAPGMLPGGPDLIGKADFGDEIYIVELGNHALLPKEVRSEKGMADSDRPCHARGAFCFGRPRLRLHRWRM